MTNFEKVREFHAAFGHPIAKCPTLVTDESLKKLRIDLIQEEFEELIEAVNDGNIVAIADALGDLEYVIHGMALVYGIPQDLIFAEIHDSNMSKLGEDGKPIYREDGKILKGPGYQPPRLAPIIQHRLP